MPRMARAGRSRSDTNVPAWIAVGLGIGWCLRLGKQAAHWRKTLPRLRRSHARPVAATPTPIAPSAQACQRFRVRSDEVVLLASIEDGIIEAVACNGNQQFRCERRTGNTP